MRFNDGKGRARSALGAAWASDGNAYARGDDDRGTAPVAMQRVRATVATNEPLDVYGGFRAPDTILDGLAAALRDGQLPFTFNHDALRPLRVANFDAGVETVANGSKQVWAEFDIEDEDLASVQEAFDQHGVPGGMSWSMSGNPRLLGTVGPDDGILRVAADAGFFDADEIAATAAELAAIAPLEISEIYQFCALPPPLVVVEIKQQSDLWQGFLVGGASSAAATLLLTFLSKLLRPRHRYQPAFTEPATAFDFKIEEDSRVVQLHLRTDDAEVLKAAFDRLPEAASRQLPTLRFDDQVGLWLPPENG